MRPICVRRRETTTSNFCRSLWLAHASLSGREPRSINEGRARAGSHDRRATRETAATKNARAHERVPN